MSAIKKKLIPIIVDHINVSNQVKKMAIRKIKILSILIGLCAFVYAQNAGDTLVLLDNLAIRETHSIFFKSLQGKYFAGGFQVL